MTELSVTIKNVANPAALTDLLEKFCRAHGVDFEVLAVAPGTCEYCGGDSPLHICEECIQENLSMDAEASFSAPLTEEARTAYVAQQDARRDLTRLVMGLREEGET